MKDLDFENININTEREGNKEPAKLPFDTGSRIKANETAREKQRTVKRPFYSNPVLKSYRNTVLFLFFFIFLIFMLMNHFTKDRTFSEVENRNLMSKPKITLEGLTSGKYFKDLSSYLEDQFIGRDMFISIKAVSEKLTLRQENNGVYINDGNILMEGFTKNDANTMKEKASVLNSFVKANLDKNMVLMLVPNKVEVYKDKLPLSAPTDDQSDFIKDFYSLLTVDLKKINLIPVFNANKNEYLYFKNDHHWTQKAAFLAYSEYMKAIGMGPLPQSAYNIKKVDNTFTGTLSNKSGLVPGGPDEVDLYVPKEMEDIVVSMTEEKKKFSSMYQIDKLNEKDKYLVFLGGNYPVVRINTSSKNDKRLLIIKDSYANCFVPFLTKAYNEITMVDLRYYSGDVKKLMKDYSITDVLFLYNINTFNDDSSILNLNDTLSSPQNNNDKKAQDSKDNKDNKDNKDTENNGESKEQSEEDKAKE